MAKAIKLIMIIAKDGNVVKEELAVEAVKNIRRT